MYLAQSTNWGHSLVFGLVFILILYTGSCTNFHLNSVHYGFGLFFILILYTMFLGLNLILILYTLVFQRICILILKTMVFGIIFTVTLHTLVFCLMLIVILDTGFCPNTIHHSFWTNFHPDTMPTLCLIFIFS